MTCSRACLLVILIFFIYKSSESFFQPTVRLFIVESVCQELTPRANRSSCRRINVTAETGVAGRLPGFSLRDENVKQAAAAKYLLAYRILLNLPAIFLSLYCGPLSDRVGRLLPMMLPSVGGVVACCILSFCLRPDLLSPLTTALIGASVYGMFGKSAVITMSCNSYLTDVSSEDARTKVLGYLLGVNFVGICIGSLLFSFYQYFASIGPALSTVAIFNCIVVVIIVFGIVESLNVFSRQEPSGALVDTGSDKEEKNSCVKFCKLTYPIETFAHLIRKRSGSKRRHLIILYLSMLINQLCKSGEQDAVLLFVQHAPLNWTGDMYGYYLCLYYACMGLNLLVTLPLLTRWCKPRDTTLIMVGILMKTVRFLMTAFAGGSTPLVYTGAVIGSSAGFIASATKSLITKLSAEYNDVGKTFAILGSMEAFSNLLGPAIFNSVYGATVAIFPGFIFVLDACLHLCLLLVFLRLRFELEDEDEDKKDAGTTLGFNENQASP